jgi:putative membrane protein
MMTQLTPLLAQAGEWHAKNLGEALLYCALFGVLGIVLVFVGFKIFDKAIAKIDLEAEICKGNVAAAVLSGAVIIAIAIIIAAAMS